MSASRVTLLRFLRRTETVEGSGFDPRPIGRSEYSWSIIWTKPKWRILTLPALLQGKMVAIWGTQLLTNSICGCRIVENTQSYEVWNGGSIPSSRTKQTPPCRLCVNNLAQISLCSYKGYYTCFVIRLSRFESVTEHQVIVSWQSPAKCASLLRSASRKGAQGFESLAHCQVSKLDVEIWVPCILAH